MTRKLDDFLREKKRHRTRFHQGERQGLARLRFIRSGSA